MQFHRQNKAIEIHFKFSWVISHTISTLSGLTARLGVFYAKQSADLTLQHRHQSVTEVQGLRTVLDARTPLHSPNAYTTPPTTAWKSLKSVRFKSVFSHHSYTLGTTKLLNRFASQPTHKTFLAERMEGNSSHELIWIWYLFQFFTVKFSAIWDLPDFLFCLLGGGLLLRNFFCGNFQLCLSAISRVRFYITAVLGVSN